MPENQSEHLDPELRRIVDAARGLWMRRLIDHSRANTLLFYRDLKVGTLDLSDEREAVDRLLAGQSLTVESLVTASSDLDSSDPVVRTRAEAEARQRVRKALVSIQRKDIG